MHRDLLVLIHDLHREYPESYEVYHRYEWMDSKYDIAESLLFALLRDGVSRVEFVRQMRELDIDLDLDDFLEDVYLWMQVVIDGGEIERLNEF